MSVKVIAWVWEHSMSRGSDRLVLLAIADNCDHDGLNAYPRMAVLAKKTGLSERSVQRSVRALAATGELLVEMNTGGNGKARPDRRPNSFQVVTAPPTGCQSVTPSPPLRGDNLSPRNGSEVHLTGCQSVTPRGDNLSPRTGCQSVTPSIIKKEPSLKPFGTVLEPSLKAAPAPPPPAAPAPTKRGEAKAARSIVARALVTDWWDERKAAGDPPAQRFVAVVGVVDGVLANGVAAEAVGWALRHVPTVSGGAIQMALSRRNGNGHDGRSSTTDTALRMIRDGRRS